MVTIRIEDDLYQDAIRTLLLISDLIRKRHGGAYRSLERRLEAVADTKPDIKIHSLDGETLIMGVPTEWAEIIAEARKLGLP